MLYMYFVIVQVARFKQWVILGRQSLLSNSNWTEKLIINLDNLKALSQR